MSDTLSAVDEARAVLEAARAGRDVVVAMLIHPQEGVRRAVIDSSGPATGTLGGAADHRARHLAAVLVGAGREGGSGGAEERGSGGDSGFHADGPVVEGIVVDGVECTLYVEMHRAPEQLVIAGAGHIAVPLARLGVLLDFRVTVLDDRETMATAERFYEGVHVVRADFATDPFAGIAIGANSYVALVTRGHRWDFDCLQRLVRRGERPKYIGMIGSRRRVRAAFHALLESGVPRDILATIRAPIGLELEAETPSEIAVAIAAEIVAVRRGAEIASISSRERVLERFL